MASEKFELGLNPLIIIYCGDNLEVRGGDRDLVIVDADDLEYEMDADEHIATLRCNVNCSIRVPEDASLDIRQASGNFRVKGVSGDINAGKIEGAALIRRVGSISIEAVGGELSLRDVFGDVALGEIEGTATLRNINGKCEVGSVHGDLLGREVNRGIIAENIDGNVVINSGFEAGSVSRLGCQGNAVFKLPSTTGVVISVPQGINLIAGQSLPVTEDNERQTVVVGDGGAQLEILSARDVMIKQHADHEEDREFSFSFSFGEELSQGLAELSADLESQFSVLESSLAATVSDRVRRHVEKRLNIARKQVEAAQRRVEEESSRVHEKAGRHISIDFGIGEKGPAAEPVSEQERMMILKMLEEGRVTVQQAESLLAALEAKK